MTFPCDDIASARQARQVMSFYFKPFCHRFAEFSRS